MRVCSTIVDFRAARAELPAQLGFVPTMGALHAGHLELVRRARDGNLAVAVSIFINPTQFTSSSDFQRYPRDPDRDLALLEAAGVDLVFTPSADELYPDGFSTTVDVGPVATPFEGTARPGHFQGVTTVVAILLNIVQPARAYFGQKDAQQLLVVRRMVADLRLPVEIVAVPTVRDTDGLALSSRNALLTPDQRRAASAIPRALRAIQQSWETGIRDPARLRRTLVYTLMTESSLTIEYASLVDPNDLAEIDGPLDGSALVLVAVRLGEVRLIDNYLLTE